MECLNLDYHIKRLLLIAISRFKTQEEQAKALGITSRTLDNYCKRYSLKYKELKHHNNNRNTKQGRGGNT